MKLEIRHTFVEHLTLDPRAEEMHRDTTRSDLSDHAIKRLLGEETAGIEVTQEYKRHRHGAGALHFGGGMSTDVTTCISVATALTATAVTVIRVLRPILIEFIRERGQRSVVVERDGQRIEIKGAADLDLIETLLEKDAGEEPGSR